MVRRFSCSFDDAANIGIVCTYQALIGENVIEEFANQLKDGGKKVNLLIFNERASSSHGIANNYFSKKDLNFFGFWKNDRVNSFIDKEFDFLLYLDLDYNPFIINVLARSKAHCRVGMFREETKPFLELMIKPKERTISSLIAEVHQQMSRIKNND